MLGRKLTWSEAIQGLLTQSKVLEIAPVPDPVVSKPVQTATPGWRVNSARNCCVSTTTSFLPINSDTPKGVKILLLGPGKVALLAEYHGEDFWGGWAPLPNTN
jgi:hypothetical protein